VDVYLDMNTALREKCGAVATPSEHNPYRKELDDMLHDLNILETIEQLTGQLRLQYEVTTTTHSITTTTTNPYRKELTRRHAA